MSNDKAVPGMIREQTELSMYTQRDEKWKHLNKIGESKSVAKTAFQIRKVKNIHFNG